MEDVVRARRFEVVDEEGRLRAVIGPGPENATGMQFYAEDGTARVELSLSGDGAAALYLRDAESKDIAMISLDAEGVPSVTVTRSGEHAAGGVGLLGSDPESGGRQGAVILSYEERPRLGLVLAADGTPYVGMYDEDGGVSWSKAGK